MISCVSNYLQSWTLVVRGREGREGGVGNTLIQWTFLACAFCFAISDHVILSWEFSFCFFMKICVHLHEHKTKFERNYSLE